ncbi:MAG: acetylglutamate kinase [Acidobacteriota bacterium]
MTGHPDREAMLAALLQALPYVRLYRGRCFVLKLGMEREEGAETLAGFAQQASIFHEFGIRLVIVHGGGPQATALAERLGVESRFVEGRRVTSPQMIEPVVMALNGSVNTAIVSALCAAGLPAVGISGVGAGLLKARVRGPVTVQTPQGPATVDYGEVGDLIAVDRSVLDRLMAAGFVPVVSPVAADETGRLLNVNADTVAAQIACALEADKLVFLTKAPGLLEDRKDPASLVSYTDLDGVAALEARGAVEGGMRPKMAAARAALQGGVRRVHVVGLRQKASLLLEVFTNAGAGTLIVKSTSELAPGEQAQPPEEAREASP